MIPDYLYKWIYLIVCTLLCFFHNAKLASYNGNNAISRFGYSTKGSAWLLLLFVAIFIGTRPLSKYFTDMYYYAGAYQLKAFDDSSAGHGELVWNTFQRICYYVFSMSSLTWIFLVALISLSCKYYACKNIFKENIYTAYLFVITAFYFWGSVTNIIRSDLALSLTLFGLSLIIKKKTWRDYIIPTIILLLTAYIHKSSVLLMVCFFASYYFVKDIRWAIGFWLLCVIMSLVNHAFFENLFIAMGFDDRVERYLTGEDTIGVFSSSGFRWDFILYSIVPIVVGWFASKKTTDRTYSTLLNTYILANGFWVLVIRALFSDRFAGISWSIYGFVLALSLMKIDENKSQMKAVSIGLVCQILFLWIMNR